MSQTDQDELDSLEPGIDEAPEQEPTPEQDAPESTEAPDVEPEPDEAPEAASTEEPEAEAPSELDQLKAQIAEYQKLVNKLAAGDTLIDKPEQEAPQGAQPAQPVQPQQPAQPKPAEPAKPLIDEETYEAIMSDPKKFNSFMEDVIKKSRADAVQEAYGLAMQHLPQAIMPAVNESARIQYEVQNWAAQNPVVSQNREYARLILDQVDGTYPQLSTQEKLDMTLKTLNAHFNPTQQSPTPSQPVQAPGPPRAAFAQAPRGGKPTPVAKTALQDELDSLTL